MESAMIKAIAEAFAGILKEWLSDDEFAEMKAANKAEQDDGVCHSHDYCDANMAMLGALIKAGAITQDQADADDFDIMDHSNLWNAAWAYAAKERLI